MHPDGVFRCGHHRPSFRAANLRGTSAPLVLGHLPGGVEIRNDANFPEGDLELAETEGVFEVPNPFPFWGATYILQAPADRLAEAPAAFRLRDEPPPDPPPARGLLRDLLGPGLEGPGGRRYGLADLPRTLKLALAQTSDDPELLAALAALACELEPGGGIGFRPGPSGEPRPLVHDHDLFEVVLNNPALPDAIKRAMALNPGVQGRNPVVGEYLDPGVTHVWEYLRANSYIPWGHYASNMAQDAVRYRLGDLSPRDMAGLRHLYYQRTFVQMAIELGLEVPGRGRRLSTDELEDLRRRVLDEVHRRREGGSPLPFTATMWGWNFGFDFSPSGYRLNATHQQIHQQFALVRPTVQAAGGGGETPSYAVGDQVAAFARRYRRAAGRDFFDAYIAAIRGNTRLDGRRGGPADLVIHEADGVLLHVPKAQRSQGEIQVLAAEPVGNVLEAGTRFRAALDRALWLAMRVLDRLGARMITVYEVSKRFDEAGTDQRLFYCFLPRHPQSPGAFSEWQQRWVTGHYPEDYAEACRRHAAGLLADLR
ncbi:hypothetical protein HCU62_04030 [Dissulfurirhabdus thermomarina]|nr:hypothetical protein [Dissulfurirhabdus thermomarina]